MSQVSDNVPSKFTVPKSSNASGAKGVVPVSANKPSLFVVPTSDVLAQGDNLSTGSFGDGGDPSLGSSFGGSEYGGIDHFQNRQKPSVSH